jgi:hypothetical protein
LKDLNRPARSAFRRRRIAAGAIVLALLALIAVVGVGVMQGGRHVAAIDSPPPTNTGVASASAKLHHKT